MELVQRLLGAESKSAAVAKAPEYPATGIWHLVQLTQKHSKFKDDYTFKSKDGWIVSERYVVVAIFACVPSRCVSIGAVTGTPWHCTMGKHSCIAASAGCVIDSVNRHALSIQRGTLAEPVAQGAHSCKRVQRAGPTQTRRSVKVFHTPTHPQKRPLASLHGIARTLNACCFPRSYDWQPRTIWRVLQPSWARMCPSRGNTWWTRRPCRGA